VADFGRYHQNRLMGAKVTITKLDGTKETYPILPVTNVAFERQYRMGMGQAAKEPHSEHTYWIAWDCERRSGKVVKPFDEWLETVADVTADREPNPFDGSLTPPSLPDSPSLPE
jgi:hypothetical protein